MLARLNSSTTIGLDALPIGVEAISVSGMPQCTIVGLLSQEVKEAKDRVYGALKASGYRYPQTKNIINLAPSDVQKHGTHFDLAIALSLVMTSEQFPKKSIWQNDTLLAKTVFLGELSLDGTVNKVRGVISVAKMCVAYGYEYLLVPQVNVAEARLIHGVRVIGVKSLREVVCMERIEREEVTDVCETLSVETRNTDSLYAQISGNIAGKRALQISAAGGHNICFFGPPGSGKSMLAKSCIELLPQLSESEFLEVMEIYSYVGEVRLHRMRPCRSVHHTTSKVALIGGAGGSSGTAKSGPGEITLAHRGVLLLDEITEFPRDCLEALRQPLEDKQIHISRAHMKYTYPADFMLIATYNPCPCGFLFDSYKKCRCTVTEIAKYEKKLSGPLRDRMDIFAYVPYESENGLRMTAGETDITEVAEAGARVARARTIQSLRFNSSSKLNSHMSLEDIRIHCKLDTSCRKVFEDAIHVQHFSPRVITKILKVARTIADMDDEQNITSEHMREALRYRESL